MMMMVMMMILHSDVIISIVINTNNCIQHSWFIYTQSNVFLCITNNSVKHQSFVYTQLNDQTVLFLTIQISVCRQFYSSTSPRHLTPYTEGRKSKYFSPTTSPPKKKNVAAIMMLYKNMKIKVRSSDGGTNYFDIVAGVLLGDILAPYLFIICLYYMLRTSIDLMKENGFKLA